MKTKTPDRKKVWKRETEIYSFDSCSIDEIIERLNELKKEFPNSELRYEEYDFSDDKGLFLYSWRYETDAEMQNRLDIDKQVEDIRRAQQRAEYERLKKIFGGE